jgi:hypothetical protein
MLQTHTAKWSDHEACELARIREACANGGDRFEFECSHTDEGDPWCVVYDNDNHRIVVHVARLDRRYFVVWPQYERSTRCATIKTAVDGVLEGLFRQSSLWPIGRPTG